MQTKPDNPRGAWGRREAGRSWVLSPAAIVAAPLLAVIASCADVVLILLRRGVLGRPADFSLLNAALATVPLSIAAGAWTCFMLLRLRREVLLRDEAEAALRAALSQRERALDREFAVRRELDHRVRNNLAGLVGLVAVYERSGRGPAALGQAIRAKIEAMRGVHDIAGRAGGGPVDLQSLLALVADSIVPLPRRRALVFGGPQVPISTGQASAMAMILQELCTNSLKHGALAGDGEVRVHWTTQARPEGAWLELRWHERALPEGPYEAREGSGVGLGLIQGFARSDLRGDFRASRTDQGWEVELHALLARPQRNEFGPTVESGLPREVCA
jgi:two-component sensor histidine kinase